MELKSILNTSAIRVVQEVEPPRIFLPDLSRAVADRYKFVRYPQSVEDFSKDSLDFAYGNFFDDAIVMKLSISNAGVWVEAPTRSDNLDRFLDDLMILLSDFGVSASNASGMSIYGSALELTMKSGFGRWFEQVQPAVAKIRSSLESAGISVSDYEVGGFTIVGEGPDTLKPPRFVLERRADKALEENTFFSQAPLSTEQHISLLAEIESLF